MSEEKHHPLRTPASDLTVGVVAGMVGVSVRTLHHYDQIGLVTPSRRTPAGYRVYDDADVARLYRVLTFASWAFHSGG
ncbi:putative MerR family transcriptional regulator [Gordonia namibiensis NBRC 108229]|uniref:Putative MerR family transcriptional regulator n=1 Tax=Gordonia namibiensis NBRC 108229 TaxID=1208314 RepID=K6X2R4_9ACTN|nr:putative MerR family transcriptional regulator [Gordonia namibiensis NBRC 108229]